MWGLSKRIRGDFKSQKGRKNVANNLGNKVKNLRNQKNMTQLELSRVVRCDRSMIGYIESGARTPGLDMLSKIAVALNTDLPSLLSK